MIKNLVLSGGATKGLAYIGFIKAMDELNIRKGLKRVIGTSVGGLMGLLIVLGLSGKQIEELFLKLDSNKLKDIKVENIMEIWSSKGHGIDSGNKLEELCRIILNKIVGNEKITMKELWEKTRIEYSVISVILNQNRWVEINHLTYPNLEVFKAIRMTTAIPIYYNSVEYDGDCYVDGAIMMNYGIELLKDELDETIGIVLREDIEKPVLGTLVEYMTHIMNLMMYQVNQLSYKDYTERTIELLFRTPSMLRTEVDHNERQKIIERGWRRMYEWWLENNLDFEIIKYGIEIKKLEKIEEKCEKQINNENYCIGLIMNKCKEDEEFLERVD